MEVTGYEKNGLFVFPRLLEDTLVFSEAPEIGQICGVCLISCIDRAVAGRNEDMTHV
jgi:hypothetical protein